MARKPGWRYSLALMAAFVPATLLAACGQQSTTSGASDNVSIGIALSPPKAIFLAPYVAQEEGFFAQQHLNVTFISMPNGLQTELGTTSGSIQFGFSSATDAIESAAANAPIHAVWSYGTKLDTVCIASSSVNSPRDLIGKNVGTTGTGGFAATLLNACLAPDNVSIDQVKSVVMQRSAFVPALVSGRISAAVFHADDAYAVLQADPSLHILNNEYETMPKWWYGGVTVLDSYAQAHKSVVERFLTAMVQADRWMVNPANKDKLVQIGVKATGESQGAVAYAVDFLLKAQVWPQNSGLDQSQEQYTAQQLYDLKEITTMPTYSQVVDSSYIDDVIKTMGQQPGS